MEVDRRKRKQKKIKFDQQVPMACSELASRIIFLWSLMHKIKYPSLHGKDFVFLALI